MQGVYTLPQLKAVLFPLFDAYGIRRAVLFGSYGKGVAYLFRLCSNAELSYSGSLIGVNLARSSFSPPVGSTGSRL